MNRPRIIVTRHLQCAHCAAGYVPGVDRCPRCGAFEGTWVRLIRVDAADPVPADVQRALDRSADKASARRFTGEPITGFGGLGS